MTLRMNKTQDYCSQTEIFIQNNVTWSYDCCHTNEQPLSPMGSAADWGVGPFGQMPEGVAA